MARSGYQVNQNVDNFLQDKPSTRLHAPPGGGSSVWSLIYRRSDDSSQFTGHKCLMMRTKMSEMSVALAKDDGRAGDSGNFCNLIYQTGQAQSATHAQISSNQYACGSNQNTGNVLTDRRITRIHAPPGGVSSIRFG
ncbi:protein [Plasmopara halstedii]|uniref:Protein n=1 Tax=Plasmopara halstedii TaxID=4781 RepID=A0A0P1ARU4_PLAHL|nr:protein [Plasmopara halstedii]CEG43894.1 protein [Plasmopara halstedii]|eukprot:XP_024580263.1 protein [Plasmopara halstedii]